MIYAYKDTYPRLEAAAFVADSADIAGDVHAGKESSFWFNVSIRADMLPVYIGEGSNIQDGSVLHVSDELECRIGSYVTVGHGVILHACTIGDNCLIGMGAIVLDGAEIGEGCIVGAGALVTQNKKFPPHSMILGSPAKAVRQLSPEEVQGIVKHSREYVELARAYGNR